MNDSLPGPSIIIEPAKTAEMIYISPQGFCGEDDFGCLGEKAPNIGEGGKVFFCSESEDMIWIDSNLDKLISF
jgi:hypothetical protein